MQKQNRSLPKFLNPLWETSSEAERGRERQVFIGKRQTIGDWREREKRELNKSWAPAPPPQNALSIHCIEYLVPGVGFDIGTPVFVQSFAWATVGLPYFKSFCYFQVVVELLFTLA